MFTLLFDKAFGVSLLICGALAGLVILYVLKKKSRPYIITALCGILLVTSCISLVNLNRYYSARGGIRGMLSSVINGENKVEMIEENKISLKNVMLTQDTDGNYSATIIPQTELSLQSGKVYNVFVNNSPCGYVESSHDYIIAKYSYNFYDKMQNYKNDTLEMYFSIDKSTKLEILTRGGEEMVKYWNYYFNRNGFVITIKEVEDNFSYKEPSASLMSSEALVNEIVQKNNLSLIKSVETLSLFGYGEGKNTYQTSCTRDSMGELSKMLNSADLVLLVSSGDSVKAMNLAYSQSWEKEGRYRYFYPSLGGVSTGQFEIKTFNYYQYLLAFLCDGVEFKVVIDYNPEFDANEWTPYSSSGTATPLAQSGGVPCNYMRLILPDDQPEPSSYYLAKGKIT